MSKEFFQHDRSALRELADLWVPGQPIEQNEAYIKRARELNKDVETALIARLTPAVTPAVISEAEVEPKPV